MGELSLGVGKLKELEFCPFKYENYVPCYYNVFKSLNSVELDGHIEYERECVSKSMKDQACLVLPPRDYKIPMRWPIRRDFIWKHNVKIKGQEFSSRSLTKRMMVEEEHISFHSDSLMVDGVEDYSHQIAEMIGLRNESNFNEAGAVVAFTATCCGPCRTSAPFFGELAKSFPNVIFLKVDVDELKSVSEDWAIEAMPTFIFLKEGTIIDKIVGALKNDLLKKIQLHLNERLGQTKKQHI